MTASSEPEERTAAGLWEALRYGLSCLIALFGAPAALALLGVLGLNERRDLLQWLAPLERLARKLLLIDALTLPTPPPKTSPRRAPKASTRRAIALDPENSAQWPARFIVLTPRAQSAAHKSNRNAMPPTPPSSWPLAERLEALLRVTENPLLYAWRLARRLARRRPQIIQSIQHNPRRRARFFATHIADADALLPVCDSS